MPDITPIIALFTKLDPHGVAVVALFFGVVALIQYLTRNQPEAKETIIVLTDLDC